jgi:PcfJ-like protein
VTINEILEHFPQKISNELVEYVTDTVLLKSRYLFTRRVGGLQKAYCTNCKLEALTDGLKHGQTAECTKCGSNCIVKASGRGRKRLIDDAFVVWYEKSEQNPEAIVARGILLVRDYSGDYRTVETQYYTKVYYLFEPGNSRMVFSDWSGLVERKKISSEIYSSMSFKESFVSTENIKAAVKGTPFQYSTWEQYQRYSDNYRIKEDMVRFFDLAAKYPCVEYLTKLGMQDIVQTKLDGRKTFGSINWRGKTIEKVLRLSKAEIKELRIRNVSLKVETLHCYQVHKKAGIKITFEEAELLSDITGWYYDDFKILYQYAPFERLSKYFIKQMKNHKKHFSSSHSVLWTLRDYIKDCIDLGMDINREHLLLPNNLHAAHQKTIRQVKIKADITLNKKIEKRLKELQKFSFKYSGMFIRPAVSSIELFDEGKALNHCVGRYAADYANGETNLFVIRKAEEPDKPYYTMEIRHNQITQVYGKNNSQPTNEVKVLVEAFKSHKLEKRSKERKVAV